MEFMEILKYTLPSLIVFLTAFFVLREMIKKDQQKQRFELIIKGQETILPIRLQAYERLTLFLERITPDSLIMRVSKPGMNVSQLQQGLLSAIRSEYGHNVSQQIYISTKAWEIIRNAKSGIIKLINTSADSLKPEDPSLNLSKLILKRTMEVERHPTQIAIEFLKAELGKIM